MSFLAHESVAITSSHAQRSLFSPSFFFVLFMQILALRPSMFCWICRRENTTTLHELQQAKLDREDAVRKADKVKNELESKEAMLEKKAAEASELLQGNEKLSGAIAVLENSLKEAEGAKARLKKKWLKEKEELRLETDELDALVKNLKKEVKSAKSATVRSAAFAENSLKKKRKHHHHTHCIIASSYPRHVSKSLQESEVHALVAEKDELQLSVSTLEKRVNEAEDLKSENARLEAEVDKLRVESQKIVHLEEENNSLSATIEKITAAHHAAKPDEESSEIKRLQSENQSLHLSIDDLKRRAAEVERLRVDNNDLKRRLKDARASKLATDLSEITSLREDNKSLSRMVKAAERKAAEATESAAKVEADAENMRQLQKDNENLSRELRNASETIEKEAEGWLKVRREDEKKFEKSLRELRASLSIVTEGEAKLGKENEMLKQTLRELEGARNELEQRLENDSKVADENIVLKQSLEKLASKQDRKHDLDASEIERLREEVRSLEGMLEDARRNHRQSKVLCGELKKDKEGASKAIEELSISVKECERKREIESDRLSSEIKRLCQEKEQTQRDSMALSSKLQGEVERAKKDIAVTSVLKEEKKTLERMLKDASIALANERSSNAALEAKLGEAAAKGGDSSNQASTANHLQAGTPRRPSKRSLMSIEGAKIFRSAQHIKVGPISGLPSPIPAMSSSAIFDQIDSTEQQPSSSLYNDQLQMSIMNATTATEAKVVSLQSRLEESGASLSASEAELHKSESLLRDSRAKLVALHVEVTKKDQQIFSLRESKSAAEEKAEELKLKISHMENLKGLSREAEEKLRRQCHATSEKEGALADLQHRHDILLKQKERHQSRLLEAEQEVEEKEIELASFRKKLRSERATATDKIDELQRAVDAASRKLSESERREEGLLVEVREMKDAKAMLEKKISEGEEASDAAARKVRALETEKGVLDRSIIEDNVEVESETFMEMKATQSRMEGEIRRGRVERIEFEVEIDKLRSKLVEAEERSRATERELESRRNDERERIKRLEDDLRESAEMRKDEREKAQREMSAELMTLRNDLEAARKAAFARNSEFKKVNERLSGVEEELKVKTTEAEQNIQEIEKLEGEKGRLDAAIQMGEEGLAEGELQWKSRIDELERELEEVKNGNAKEESNVKEKIGKAEKELDAARESIARITKDRSRAEGELTDLKGELEKLRVERSKVEEDRARLQGDIERMQDRMRSANSEMIAVLEEVGELKKGLCRAKNEKIEAEESAAGLEGQLKRLSDDKSRLEATIELMSSAEDDCEQKLRASEESARGLEKKVTVLEEELVQLREARRKSTEMAEGSEKALRDADETAELEAQRADSLERRLEDEKKRVLRLQRTIESVEKERSKMVDAVEVEKERVNCEERRAAGLERRLKRLEEERISKGGDTETREGEQMVSEREAKLAADLAAMRETVGKEMEKSSRLEKAIEKLRSGGAEIAARGNDDNPSTAHVSEIADNIMKPFRTSFESFDEYLKGIESVREKLSEISGGGSIDERASVLLEKISTRNYQDEKEYHSCVEELQDVIIELVRR